MKIPDGYVRKLEGLCEIGDKYWCGVTPSRNWLPVSGSRLEGVSVTICAYVITPIDPGPGMRGRWSMLRGKLSASDLAVVDWIKDHDPRLWK